MPFGLEAFAAPFVLLLLAAMLAAFVWERFPPEVVGIAAVALLLAVGVLTPKDMLSVFSNSAPATIGAMFILSGALMRTGAIEAFAKVVMGLAENRPTIALTVTLLAVMVASAFVNNTPVVIVLIPVMIRLAQSLGQAPSRVLIPLSYATILGGTCTMIGTSTNLLVDGVARKAGLEPFGLFEISSAGVVMGVVGILYMTLVGNRFLPDRQSVTSLLGDAKRPRFLTEVMIPLDSPLIGKPVLDVPLFKRADGRVIDVLRGEESLRRKMDTVVLQPGDRVVLKTRVAEVMSLREEGQVDFPGTHALEPMAARQTVVVEGLVGPSSPMAGHAVGSLRIRRRYAVYPLAVHRAGENISANLDGVVLQVGDALLLEGAPDDVRRLSDAEGLINLSEPTDQPYRRSKAPFVVAVVLAVVLAAAFNVMDITGLAVIGVAAVLLFRCVDAEEAFRAVDWRILILILAMLAVGEAMEKTGAVKIVVDAAIPFLHGLPPFALLCMVYLLSMVLTEIVTNNAVAVLVTPIAISIAQQTGVDPRPLVVAVMFGASASFATPIGYQTNTMVYTAGGYRFADFLRVGVPMNIIVGIAAVLAIAMFWDL